MSRRKAYRSVDDRPFPLWQAAAHVKWDLSAHEAREKADMSTSTMTGSTVKDKVRATIEQQSGKFVRLAHETHAHPQLAFAEE